MGDQIIMGFDAPDTTTISGAVLRLFRVQAQNSGIISEMRLTVADTNGKVVLGIYADAGGSPGGLLRSSGIFIAKTTVAISSITPLSVSGGEFFWIAMISQYNTRRDSSETATQLYKSYNIDLGLPDPVGTGYATAARSMRFSAWGTLATGGAGRLIGVGDPGLITVCHPKLITVGRPSLIRARGG